MTDSVISQYMAEHDSGGGGMAMIRPGAGFGAMAMFSVQPRSVIYTWDKVGNRTNVNDSISGSVNYTPDDINRYTQVGTDAVTSGPEHQLGGYQANSYSYMADTFLANITSGTNTYMLYYDALGRCVKRTSTGVNAGTTYYVYDGDKAILETGLTNATNVYGIGIDEIVLRTVGSTNYFYYQDHEGSITHIYNGATLTEQYRYDVFGAPTIADGNGTTLTNPSPAIGNRFMFTGREYTATFGVYEYRNRAYHPGLGRFMSEDPKGFAAGDYNLFRYCKNDPEDFADPMGTYGRPLGEWTEDLWKKFAKDQQNAIRTDSAAKNAIDHALANGKDKASESTLAAFKKVFGASNRGMMEKVSGALSARLNALRDDGGQGYWAHPTTDKQLSAQHLDPNRVVAYTHHWDKNIYVNVAHGWSNSQLAWSIDHEAGHSAVGLSDIGYMHQAWAVNAMRPEDALKNADSHTAFAHAVTEP